jgi:hypothetical protein
MGFYLPLLVSLKKLLKDEEKEKKNVTLVDFMPPNAKCLLPKKMTKAIEI